MITTEAWVLRQGSDNAGPGELELASFSFSELEPNELLAEPLYGCWEANMAHAIDRTPVDICRLRMETSVVIGNAGVLRVLECGAAVQQRKPGDVVVLVPIGTADRHGNLTTVHGYDAKGSIGMLAKRIKLREDQTLPVPHNTRYSLRQWAAFCLRYSSAWCNWKATYGTFRSFVSERELPAPWVWGWGGGVALAELELANLFGCRTALIASGAERLEMIRQRGVLPIDRAAFKDVDYDGERYHRDRGYRAQYLRAEGQFIRKVREVTNNERVSVFIDNIGQSVFTATLKALADPGVVTSCGWKTGASLSFNRTRACMHRQQFVNTHGCSLEQGIEALKFGEERGWMPADEARVFGWDEIPTLARLYAEGRLSTYFPLFEVNRP